MAGLLVGCGLGQSTPRMVIPISSTRAVEPGPLLKGRYLFVSFLANQGSAFESGEFICDGSGICQLDSQMNTPQGLVHPVTTWTIKVDGYKGYGTSTAGDTAYLYINDSGSW